VSPFAQHCQRAGVERPACAEYTRATHQHSADQRQYQQPGMGLPFQFEGVAVQHEAHQFAAQRRQHAADRAQQSELDASGLDQQRAIGPQCPEQRTLTNAFIQRRLQAREQHRKPAASTNSSTYCTARVT
jgi:hypothetical protein